MGDKLLKDATGQEIVAELKAQNVILKSMSRSGVSGAVSSLSALKKMSKNGALSNVLKVGDIITVPWTDTGTGVEYEVPFHISAFRDDVVRADGTTGYGTVLESHYALPGVQFDNTEAAYYCTSALAAGDYSITFPSNSPWNQHKGTFYFTLTSAVPAGGILRIAFHNGEKYTGTTWFVQGWSQYKVQSYSSVSAENYIEEVTSSATATEDITYTDLGTVSRTEQTDNLNYNDESALGSNRWATSAVRQYLNSNAALGNWWRPQHNFDFRPNELFTKAGFLTGFEQEFLDILEPVQVNTKRNTLNGGGAIDTTYDIFFLASLEENYIAPETSGVEGDYWPYWKKVFGLSSPLARNTNFDANKRYAIEAQTVAQAVRLRSADQGNGGNTWYVNPSGHVFYYSAASALRLAPACLI